MFVSQTGGSLWNCSTASDAAGKLISNVSTSQTANNAAVDVLFVWLGDRHRSLRITEHKQDLIRDYMLCEVSSNWHWLAEPNVIGKTVPTTLMENNVVTEAFLGIISRNVVVWKRRLVAEDYTISSLLSFREIINENDSHFDLGAHFWIETTWTITAITQQSREAQFVYIIDTTIVQKRLVKSKLF